MVPERTRRVEVRGRVFDAPAVARPRAPVDVGWLAVAIRHCSRTLGGAAYPRPWAGRVNKPSSNIRYIAVLTEFRSGASARSPSLTMHWWTEAGVRSAGSLSAASRIAARTVPELGKSTAGALAVGTRRAPGGNGRNRSGGTRGRPGRRRDVHAGRRRARGDRARAVARRRDRRIARRRRGRARGAPRRSHPGAVRARRGAVPEESSDCVGLFPDVFRRLRGPSLCSLLLYHRSLRRQFVANNVHHERSLRKAS